jgi:hypothetical protein
MKSVACCLRHSKNKEATPKCKQCGQKKSAQKATCAVCRQSTEIPSTNFSDSLKSGVTNVSRSTKKVYYDVAVSQEQELARGREEAGG